MALIDEDVPALWEADMAESSLRAADLAATRLLGAATTRARHARPAQKPLFPLESGSPAALLLANTRSFPRKSMRSARMQPSRACRTLHFSGAIVRATPGAPCACVDHIYLRQIQLFFYARKQLPLLPA